MDLYEGSVVPLEMPEEEEIDERALDASLKRKWAACNEAAEALSRRN